MPEKHSEYQQIYTQTINLSRRSNMTSAQIAVRLDLTVEAVEQILAQDIANTQNTTTSV